MSTVQAKPNGGTTKNLGSSRSSRRRPKIIGPGKFSSGLNDLGSNKKHLKRFGR